MLDSCAGHAAVNTFLGVFEDLYFIRVPLVAFGRVIGLGDGLLTMRILLGPVVVRLEGFVLQLVLGDKIANGVEEYETS